MTKLELVNISKCADALDYAFYCSEEKYACCYRAATGYKLLWAAQKVSNNSRRLTALGHLMIAEEL